MPDTLDAHLKRLRSLPAMAERAAPAIASAVERELRASIAAGTSPEGVAWAPTKDGRRALVHAGVALIVSHVGGQAIVAKVTGVEAMHSNGWVRGGIARPMLPKAGTIPAPVASAIDDVLAREFSRTMGGR